MSRTVLQYDFTGGAAANADGSCAGVPKGTSVEKVTQNVPGYGRITSALRFGAPPSFVEVPFCEPLSNLPALAIEVAYSPGAPSDAERQNLVELQETPIAMWVERRRPDAFVVRAAVKLSTGWVHGPPAHGKGPTDSWHGVAAVFTGDELVLLVDDEVRSRRVLSAARIAGGERRSTYMGTWIDGSKHQLIGRVGGVRITEGVPARLAGLVAAARETGLGECSSLYADLGGETGALGKVTSPFGRESTGAGGKFLRCERGSVTWHPLVGAHELHGAIGEKWRALGGPDGFLGYPLTDEEQGFAATARVSRFGNGAIYWSAGTGAHEVHGDIYLRYRALRQDGGLLGLPVSDEEDAPGGRRTRFQHGTIYWSAGSGAHEVHGAILEKYEALGGPGGWLGYPQSDEVDVLAPAGGKVLGKATTFSGGTIYWSTSGGARAVAAAFLGAYHAAGGPSGPWGWPVSDSGEHEKVHYTDFEKGVATVRDGTATLHKALKVEVQKLSTKPMDDGMGDDSVEPYAFLDLWLDGKKQISGAKIGPNNSPVVHVDVDFTTARLRHDTVVRLLFTIRDDETVVDCLGKTDIRIDLRDHFGTTLKGGSPRNYALTEIRDRSTVTKKDDVEITVLTQLDPEPPSWPFRSDKHWWSFDNFETPVLDDEEYVATFADVDYTTGVLSTAANAFDAVFYEVYKGLARPGNCFGMALEAVYSWHDRGQGEPLYRLKASSEDGRVVDDESQVPGPLRKAINVKHGYQVGMEAIGWYAAMLGGTAYALGDGTPPPLNAKQVYALVSDRLRQHEFCLLSFFDTDALEGHTVLAVGIDESKGRRILIADPNDPFLAGDAPDVAVLQVNDDDTWHYRRRDKVRSSGDAWRSDYVPRTVLMPIPYRVLASPPVSPAQGVLDVLHPLGGFIAVGGADLAQVHAGGRDMFTTVGGKRRMSTLPPGMSPIPVSDDGKAIKLGGPRGPLLLAQAGALPDDLRLDLRTTHPKGWQVGLLGSSARVSVSASSRLLQRDTVSAAGFGSARPAVSVRSDVDKAVTVDYAVLRDRSRRPARAVRVELTAGAAGPARVGADVVGPALIVTTPVAAPVSLTVRGVRDGKPVSSRYRVPAGEGEEIRVQPADLASPLGAHVVQRLAAGRTVDRLVLDAERG